MKVFLRKDIEKVGLKGEFVKVSEGYAKNFLIPRGLAVAVTGKSEQFFKDHERVVENRKVVIATQSSMLAEKMGSIHLIIKRKMHDDGKLYGAINSHEIVDALAKKGVTIAKNQVIFGKSIKEKGSYDVTIKLSLRLQPKIKVTIISE